MTALLVVLGLGAVALALVVFASLVCHAYAVALVRRLNSDGPLAPPDPHMWAMAEEERRRFRSHVRSIRSAHPGWRRFYVK